MSLSNKRAGHVGWDKRPLSVKYRAFFGKPPPEKCLRCLITNRSPKIRRNCTSMSAENSGGMVAGGPAGQKGSTPHANSLRAYRQCPVILQIVWMCTHPLQLIARRLPVQKRQSAARRFFAAVPWRIIINWPRRAFQRIFKCVSFMIGIDACGNLCAKITSG